MFKLKDEARPAALPPTPYMPRARRKPAGPAARPGELRPKHFGQNARQARTALASAVGKRARKAAQRQGATRFDAYLAAHRACREYLSRSIDV